jgi:hypothetical protein
LVELTLIVLELGHLSVQAPQVLLVTHDALPANKPINHSRVNNDVHKNNLSIDLL